MNRKFKNILILVIGIIIGSTIGVIGSNVITANQVGINSSKTTKTNIQDAIDELYDKASMIGFKVASSTGKTVITSGLPTGVKAIVYLDPTDLSKSCNASNSVSTTGTKTGCMKWYAYSEDNEYYTMILDHNTTSKIAYNSSAKNTYPKTIQPEIDKLVTVSNWKVTPRMISATEIVKITGNTTWTPGGSGYYFDTNGSRDTSINTAGASAYAWLFDYTGNCIQYGCNIEDDSTYGYWTSTAYNSYSTFVWHVDNGGSMYSGGFPSPNASSTNYGLRPVITILK